MPDLYTFLIVCPLVLLAGFVDAIGGGGGLISLPAYLLAGLPAHQAIATNKLSSTCGTGLATFRFARRGLIDWRLSLPAMAAGLLGSWGGAHLSLLVDAGVLEKVLYVILPLTALLVLRKDVLPRWASGSTTAFTGRAPGPSSSWPSPSSPTWTCAAPTGAARRSI